MRRIIVPFGIHDLDCLYILRTRLLINACGKFSITPSAPYPVCRHFPASEMSDKTYTLYVPFVFRRINFNQYILYY